MKTKIKFILSCALFISISMPSIYAQQTEKNLGKNLSKHEIKELKKQQRDANNQADFEKAKAALEHGNWVLEADRIYPEFGSPMRVSERDNFVSLENNTSLIKLSKNLFYGSYHVKYLDSYIKSLGSGITLKGNPTKIQMNEDKFGNVIYQMNLIGTAMTANLTLTLDHKSNRAEIIVSSIGTDARFRLMGELVPVYESTAYKGGTNF